MPGFRDPQIRMRPINPISMKSSLLNPPLAAECEKLTPPISFWSAKTMIIRCQALAAGLLFVLSVPMLRLWDWFDPPKTS
jgi:hypothetical protein